MASILKGGGLALALIFLIIVSSSFKTVTVANARFPYKRARHLETDCDSPVQHEIPGCGAGGDGGDSGLPTPSGHTPIGSSRCENGCCGENKMGDCECCP